MKFLKKNVKFIIGIIVGAILISGISVYATSTYLASQIEYNNNGQAKVSDALDDLYNKLPTRENIKITETKSGIDVRNILTIDTSDLYSKAQDGENVFFKSYSIELDSNGYGMINNIGFTPNTVICVWSKTNESAYEHKNINNGGTFFGTNGDYGDIQSNDNTIVFGTNKVTFNGTAYWGNATLYAVIFKATL